MVSSPTADARQSQIAALYKAALESAGGGPVPGEGKLLSPCPRTAPNCRGHLKAHWWAGGLQGALSAPCRGGAVLLEHHGRLGSGMPGARALQGCPPLLSKGGKAIPSLPHGRKRGQYRAWEGSTSTGPLFPLLLPLLWGICGDKRPSGCTPGVLGMREARGMQPPWEQLGAGTCNSFQAP